jgi:hypothetical protein
LLLLLSSLLLPLSLLLLLTLSLSLLSSSVFRNRKNRSVESNDENYGYGKAADWWSLGA